ncbi:hypothetical protein VQ056_16810 [Paenibacillus sp. JTLBN-2024]
MSSTRERGQRPTWNFTKLCGFTSTGNGKSAPACCPGITITGYEIFYLVSGDICYFIGDRAYQAVSGALFVIDMNEIHKLVNAGGASFERVTLEFKKEFLDDLFAGGMPVDVMSVF